MIPIHYLSHPHENPMHHKLEHTPLPIYIGYPIGWLYMRNLIGAVYQQGQ